MGSALLAAGIGPEVQGSGLQGWAACRGPWGQSGKGFGDDNDIVLVNTLIETRLW